MLITKRIVAERIAAYLQGRLSLQSLVDWAENALLEADFAEADASVLSPVVARLGVADVRAFGLAWEDCEHLLRELGYTARVEIVPV
jgi:cobyrinic acid a,c-diamide synthase